MIDQQMYNLQLCYLRTPPKLIFSQQYLIICLRAYADDWKLPILSYCYIFNVIFS